MNNLLKNMTDLGFESALETIPNLDIQELQNESAIICKAIEDAQVVQNILHRDADTMTFETAFAYALPLYGYDKNALMEALGEELNTETAASKSLHVSFTIDETIKKLFRMFYVLFKKVQQKIILWLNDIKPVIEALKKLESTLDFSKTKDLDDESKKKAVELLGAFALFNGKLDDSAATALIASFGNLKSYPDVISGYKSIIEKVGSDIKANNYEWIKFSVISKITKDNFFDKVPKVYEKISDVLETNINSKNITGGNFDKSVPTKVLVTDGNRLFGVTTNHGKEFELKNFNYKVNAEYLSKEVSTKPIKDNLLSKLITTIEKVDLKDLSEKVRTEFSNLEKSLNTYVKDNSGFDIPEGLADGVDTSAQIAKYVFSNNISLINTLSFEIINMNAKLLSNSLKYVKLNFDHYEKKVITDSAHLIPNKK